MVIHICVTYKNWCHNNFIYNIRNERFLIYSNWKMGNVLQLENI